MHLGPLLVHRFADCIWFALSSFMGARVQQNCALESLARAGFHVQFEKRCLGVPSVLLLSLDVYVRSREELSVSIVPRQRNRGNDSRNQKRNGARGGWEEYMHARARFVPLSRWWQFRIDRGHRGAYKAGHCAHVARSSVLSVSFCRAEVQCGLGYTPYIHGTRVRGVPEWHGSRVRNA